MRKYSSRSDRFGDVGRSALVDPKLTLHVEERAGERRIVRRPGPGSRPQRVDLIDRGAGELHRAVPGESGAVVGQLLLQRNAAVVHAPGGQEPEIDDAGGHHQADGEAAQHAGEPGGFVEPDAPPQKRRKEPEDGDVEQREGREIGNAADDRLQPEVRPARIPALHPRRRHGQHRKRERQCDDGGAPESHASDRFW